MEFKKIWNETLVGTLIKNILIAGIIIVVLCWFTLFLIDRYTRHGQTETVPDLKGLYVEEAQSLLKKQKLYVEVVDSVYVKGSPLGSVIEQTPVAGSVVKRDRPIYLVINSREIKQIPLPDLVETSYRQADATLKAIGMNVQSVEYIPSEYKDLVLGVKYQGNEVKSGTRLPDGSSVVLVVGHGLGENTSLVPNVRGINLEQARETIFSSGFVLGSSQYDVAPSGDEAEYVIYRQRPKIGKTAPAGTRIDVWLSKDRTLLDKNFDAEDDDEEFF